MLMLGSRKERLGHVEHATENALHAFYVLNTGDLMKEAKEGGKEAREPPTKLRCLHEESHREE